MIIIMTIVGALVLILLLLNQGADAAEVQNSSHIKMVNCGDFIRSADDVWGANVFTKPENHNPNHYTYLIHAIDESPRKRAEGESLTVHIESKLARLASATSLSTSVIQTGRVSTMGRFGFILSPPQRRDVLVMRDKDLGFIHEDLPKNKNSLEYWIKNVYGDLPFVEPQKLIQHQSEGFGNNEVVIAGPRLHPSAEIRAIGLFYLADDKGREFIDQESKEALQRISTRLGIPLIRIEIRTFF